MLSQPKRNSLNLSFIQIISLKGFGISLLQRNFTNLMNEYRLVLMTCIYAPYTLSFLDIVPKSLENLDTVINFIFLIDIFVNMISAYQDENFEMIDDNCVKIFFFLSKIGACQKIHIFLVLDRCRRHYSF